MDGLFAQIIVVACLVESIVLHEIAHGYVALLFGDQTAKRQGRITLNPIPHIDPIWTVLIPLAAYFLSSGTFIIGGAKPVPVNPYYYRRQVAGDIWVSVAGVAVNFAIAVVMILLLNLVYLGSGIIATTAVARVLVKVATLNILLALFNLIPIPPLDGSHLFKYLLPEEFRDGYENLGRTGMGFILLILAINIPAIWHVFSVLVYKLDNLLLGHLIFV